MAGRVWKAFAPVMETLYTLLEISSAQLTSAAYNVPAEQWGQAAGIPADAAVEQCSE